MVYTPLLLSLLFTWLLPNTAAERVPVVAAPEVIVEIPASALLYNEIGLDGELAEPVFEAGYERMQRMGVQGSVLAIADMTQPSTAKRLYLIDLERKELVMRTYVAHGQGSGELIPTSFSDKEGSHQSSLGLYRVGAEIVSPKHGAALLLHGLERGLNGNALSREVIMHGADYVSEQFIAAHGRSGRSWGCPAVPREDMKDMIDLLADGGLLFVYGRR
ncbi:MAG: murein L,D-transpeptidase catalytic domain family protein [Flavobacteriales bacterium]|nr:murein L,D-transpeptidase catalytic domain family protein [Flavobacteriales bacterium]